jgi:hypothetical protein
MSTVDRKHPSAGGVAARKGITDCLVVEIHCRCHSSWSHRLQRLNGRDFPPLKCD